MLNIALPKGRLGDSVYALFRAAGAGVAGMEEGGRRLVFCDEEKELRDFWVKPSDVATYVWRGAADIGVAGKDVLLEQSPDVYELLDLNLGKCSVAIAAKNGFCDNPDAVLRVGTKYPNIARDYYSGLSREIDVIELHGSNELAPLLGLSDVILDIVETGRTLKENDLGIISVVRDDISARLIVNRGAFRFKEDRILPLVEDLKKLI